jgi:hypothetical protein
MKSLKEFEDPSPIQDFITQVIQTVKPNKEFNLGALEDLTRVGGDASSAARAAEDAARASEDAARAAEDAARAGGDAGAAGRLAGDAGAAGRLTGDAGAAVPPVNAGEELRNGVPVKTEDASIQGSKPGERLGAGNKDPKVEQAGLNPRETPEAPIEPARKEPIQWKDKFTKAGYVVAAGLPLGLLLAAITQGLLICDAVNGNSVAGPAHKDPMPDRIITKVESAATPVWPDWLPARVKKMQIQKTQVYLTYKDAFHILKTDTIDVKHSNVFDKNGYTILDNSTDDRVLIDIGKNWESKFSNVANVATFTVHTKCEDRIAYMAGQDFAVLGKAVSQGAMGFGEGLGAFAEAMPWKSILIGIAVVVLFFFFIKAISALKGG